MNRRAAGGLSYAVIGATGNIGGKLTQSLLRRGASVRAIAREPGRLSQLAQAGADPRAGDIADTEFLGRAFEGVDAVFSMLPPHYAAEDLRAHQAPLSFAIASAIERSGVQHVVNLSSVGAQLAEGAGIIAPLRDHEQRLDAIAGCAVVHLRPGYFMENLFSQLAIIAQRGVVSASIRGDLPMALVATADIASVAAEELLSGPRAPGSRVRYVLGPRDRTYVEMTRVLAEALGRPELRFVQATDDEAEEVSVSIGMSRSVARALTEYIRSVNDGRVMAPVVRDAESTTPTALEALAPAFAAAYRSMSSRRS